MKHIRYKFLIDPDVIKKYNLNTLVQREYIAICVSVYLNDPEGWAKQGYFFESVDQNEKVLIRLSEPSTIEKVC
jgi:hypothetical protein